MIFIILFVSLPQYNIIIIMCTIIGRKKEKAQLQRVINSGRAEFVAVYGRRRVGKTYLINEMIHDHVAFRHTGLSPYDRTRRVTLKEQLKNFHFSLLRYGMENIAQPKSWMEAFFMLEQLLEQKYNGTRQVVFIDELPWMDTARSGFLTALETFWNGWGNSRHELCLIVCGSATSWMLDSLINNKGGLYGRLTCEIYLAPFTLRECEEFYRSRDITMSRYNIVQAYMIMGGIPFYMNCFTPSLSLAQNIDALFFDNKPKLGDEFNRLFNSLFDNADACMKIVRTLSKRHGGYTRDEIAQRIGCSANGDFTKNLKALIASDFVCKYQPLGYGKREEHYKLIDHFCWFWLFFKENKTISQTDYWQHHLQESDISVWRGIAFEELCFCHVSQIKQALQIAGVSSVESEYVSRGEDGLSSGMQIDLIINRQDDVVNACEMKFTKAPFIVSNAYAQTIELRRETLEKFFPHKTVHATLVTNLPMSRNSYSDVFQSEIVLDDLFV